LSDSFILVNFDNFYPNPLSTNETCSSIIQNEAAPNRTSGATIKTRSIAMKTIRIAPHRSSLGFNANIASIIIYIAMAVVSWIPYLGWVAWAVPLVFFFLEKESRFVKFQAVQALIIGIIRAGLAIILQIFIWILTPRNIYSAAMYLTGRGWGALAALSTISVIIAIAISLVILYMIYKAYKYEQVELPLIGKIATRASEKLDTVNIQQQWNNPAQSNQPPSQWNNPAQNNQAPLQWNDPAQSNQAPSQWNDPVQSNQEPATFCQNCGAQILAGMKFCNGCGTQIF